MMGNRMMEKKELTLKAKSTRYNFTKDDMEEWDFVRAWIKELLKKKHKDYKIACEDKSVEV